MTYKSVLTLPTFSSFAKIIRFRSSSSILHCETETLLLRIKSEFIRPGRNSPRFNRAPATGSVTDGSRIGSSRRRLGQGVQVLVRYLKIVYSKQFAFVAPLDESTFEQPQAHGKNLSGTCSVNHVERVLQSQNQSHLLLTSFIFATQPRPTHKGTPRLKDGTR